MSLYGLKCAIARSVGWTLAIAAAACAGAALEESRKASRADAWAAAVAFEAQAWAERIGAE